MGSVVDNAGEMIVLEGLEASWRVGRYWLRVYYEKHNDIYSAIAREKQMKKWKRQWKINLIEKFNPDWIDLFKDLTA